MKIKEIILRLLDKYCTILLEYWLTVDTENFSTSSYWSKAIELFSETIVSENSSIALIELHLCIFQLIFIFQRFSFRGIIKGMAKFLG